MNANKRTVLMIAFDFPPCQSAGVQRTLKFAEYLLQYGWQPIILTVKDFAHAKTDSSVSIPESLQPYVFRTSALDASRHLAVKGKYFSWSRIPDKYWTWSLTAIREGKKLIKQFRPDAVWSTYPIPTAHLIAYRLQKYSQLPWIADFRDPVQCRYDKNSQQYAWAAKWIERKTVKHAKKVIFTTQQAVDLYRDLYPFESEDKFDVITNGFDHALFERLNLPYQKSNDKFTLLYSGAVYPNGRDPSAVFDAIADLHKEGKINSDNFELVFQGMVDSQAFDKKLEDLGIQSMVHFQESVSYIESLKSMSNASALLVIQDALFKNQIPGKVYEYLRIGKPIVAITPKHTATADLLDEFEYTITSVHSAELASGLRPWLSSEPPNIQHSIDRFSRKSTTQRLAQTLEKVVAGE